MSSLGEEKKFTALVTGGSAGIGKAIVEKLILQGFKVIVIARNMENLKTLKSGVNAPEHCYIYAADVSNKQMLFDVLAQIKKDFSTIDMLVNNAGVFIPGSLLEEKDDDYEMMMRTNIDSVYYICKSIISRINTGGYIFNICSTASIVGYTNGATYCISKFALLGLTKVLRAELKGKLAVSAILPGATLTNSWSGTQEPAARFIKPEDVAEMLWCAWKIRSNAVMEEIIIRPHLGDF